MTVSVLPFTVPSFELCWTAGENLESDWRGDKSGRVLVRPPLGYLSSPPPASRTAHLLRRTVRLIPASAASLPAHTLLRLAPTTFLRFCSFPIPNAAPSPSLRRTRVKHRSRPLQLYRRRQLHRRLDSGQLYRPRNLGSLDCHCAARNRGRSRRACASRTVV